MIKAYYTAANGARSNKSYLDVISNNMANIQTAGFKKSKPEFSDLVYTNMRGSEGANTELKSGSGSKINKTDLIWSQGTLYQTGVNTDFAILGDGFFAVQFEEGNFFTRSGSFEITNINDVNYLTYHGGYVLNIQEEPIIIGNEGSINNADLGVFSFDNNSDLQQAGNNLFRLSNENAEYNLAEAGVLQGSLEASNVEVSEEMIKLIQIQRAFQLNTTVIQTADQIEQTINSLRG